jgi:hypothetical protein
MWKCNICQKKVVKDKGKGFRVFIEYVQRVDLDTYESKSICKHQIRICSKCLNNNYETIKL